MNKLHREAGHHPPNWDEPLHNIGELNGYNVILYGKDGRRLGEGEALLVTGARELTLYEKGKEPKHSDYRVTEIGRVVVSQNGIDRRYKLSSGILQEEHAAQRGQ